LPANVAQQKEPVLYRASAAFAIAYSLDDDRGAMVDYYRLVTEISQSMPADDVDQPIIPSHDDHTSTAGRLVSRMVDLAKLILRLLMNRDETKRDPEYLNELSKTHPRNLQRACTAFPAEPTPIPLENTEASRVGWNCIRLLW
jgi:hypothetical protein